ncbi:RIO1 family regulatory kinase/ATPase [Chitinivibrio alkaliphilus]|uniref:non-specific serine/threonine protein kinase n=1 Tax=Chitinivibrio alkaliphilus ACht1 TaxID=1313304 RepID=U7DAI4_9BACT|nr:RIO1 family regulatory kinase/ATPase [Chitinivibrio alkaliphilus]ERP39042.1 RIO-type serine/threonine protein kinase [Chitinivibrio alkaliphilus ACht1]
MRIPAKLKPLLEEGYISNVVQNLKSGKEADVFLVESRGGLCCAKVYKDHTARSFRSHASYEDGRKTGNSRRDRAMRKKSRYGRAVHEQEWHQAEVNALSRLHALGISVPEAHFFLDGVLVMEAVLNKEENVALPLIREEFTPQEAALFHVRLIRECAAMLCEGIIHGDLSPYNILRGAEGPVIIDLPQWVDAAQHTRAREFFLRDVHNVTSFFSTFHPPLSSCRYGEEMWELYTRGELSPRSPLTGEWKDDRTDIEMGDTLFLIRHAEAEEMERRERLAARLEGREDAGEYRN